MVHPPPLFPDLSSCLCNPAGRQKSPSLEPSRPNISKQREFGILDKITKGASRRTDKPLAVERKKKNLIPQRLLERRRGARREIKLESSSRAAYTTHNSRKHSSDSSSNPTEYRSDGDPAAQW